MSFRFYTEWNLCIVWILVKNGIENADEKIRDIIHKQQATLAVNKPTSAVDDEYKRRLLEQYSHVEEDCHR